MDRRFLLFIVITFVIMGTYPFLLERLGFAPVPPAPNPVGETQQNETAKENTKAPSPKDLEERNETLEERQEAPRENRAPENRIEEEIIIQTPLYQARLSSKGGELLAWKLKSHTEEDRKTSIVLFSKKTAVSPGFSVSAGDPEIDLFLREQNYAVEGERRIILRSNAIESCI